MDKVRIAVADDVSRRTLSTEKSAPTNVGGYFVIGPVSQFECGQFARLGNDAGKGWSVLEHDFNAPGSQGLIDDVAIFTNALTATQILST